MAVTRAEELAEKLNALLRKACYGPGTPGLQIREHDEAKGLLAELVADAEALAEALERIAERRAFAPNDRNYIGASPSIAREALARYRGEK